MNQRDILRNPRHRVAPPAIIAFDQALSGVQIECGQLLIAIRQLDCEDAEIAAGDAVASYLVAQAALRRLEARPTEPAEDLRSASLALGDARQALEQLFDRASEQIAQDSLHWLLRQLRLTLAISNDEPPPLETGDTTSR